MTEVVILLSLSTLTLIGVVAALVALRERDHSRWASLEKDLLDRIMVKSPSEYVALKRAEAETQEEKKPVEMTTEYDKAWSA